MLMNFNSGRKLSAGTRFPPLGPQFTGNHFRLCQLAGGWEKPAKSRRVVQVTLYPEENQRGAGMFLGHLLGCPWQEQDKRGGIFLLIF